jgi:CRISPR-associated protein Cas2
MPKIDFVIAYDIANPKRLRKVARVLESTSIRIQKSIFFYPNASKDDITKLCEKLETIINKEEDDIRIYNVNKKNSISLKSAIDLKYPTIIVGDIS